MEFAYDFRGTIAQPEELSWLLAAHRVQNWIAMDCNGYKGSARLQLIKNSSCLADFADTRTHNGRKMLSSFFWPCYKDGDLAFVSRARRFAVSEGFRSCVEAGWKIRLLEGL